MNKGYTTPEQAAAQQAAYRSKCSYYRKGKVIYSSSTGKIEDIFNSINKAKKSRLKPRYTV